MVSPVAPSIKAGQGHIGVTLLPPSVPALSALGFTYPLRLISPPSNSLSQCVLVFMLTYGGGLVAGDKVDLHINVLHGARLALLTQGSTKIYKTPSRDVRTRQCLTATVEANAALLLLPDPVQPFKDSVYEQCQVFNIDPLHSSVLLLDWVSEGRTSRGEKWSLWEYKTSNLVWSLPNCGSGEKYNEKRRLLMRDNLNVDGTSSFFRESLQERMDNLGVFGTLIIRGPVFQRLGQFFLDEFLNLPRIGGKNWSTRATNASADEDKRAGRRKREIDSGLLWTATSTRGFVIVKFGARAVEGARQWLKEMLREDGTVEKEFGERCLLCLR